MILLIDVGNTRLKWTTVDAGVLAPTRALAHDEPALAESLVAAWHDLSTPSAALVSSVVDAEREARLALAVRERFGIEPTFARTPAAALGVTVAYAEPARFGVDRFLALAALHGMAPRAQVLASVGTALTLDALDATGRHLGGLIAASPSLARRALTGATARLLDVPGALVEIARDTQDAITSGTVLAAVALIERFRSETAARLGAAPALVVTGGGADEVIGALPHAERADDLVLRGLARWAASGAAD